MFADRREAIAAAIAAGAPGLAGNVHAWPPDVIAPPVAWVDRCQLNRDRPTLTTLSFTATVVIVADGTDRAARMALDDNALDAWVAVGKADCTGESAADDTVPASTVGGTTVVPVYPAVRLVVSSNTTTRALTTP